MECKERKINFKSDSSSLDHLIKELSSIFKLTGSIAPVICMQLPTL